MLTVSDPISSHTLFPPCPLPPSCPPFSQGVLSSLNGRSGVVCEILSVEEWEELMKIFPTDYCLKYVLLPPSLSLPPSLPPFHYFTYSFLSLILNSLLASIPPLPPSLPPSLPPCRFSVDPEDLSIAWSTPPCERYARLPFLPPFLPPSLLPSLPFSFPSSPSCFTILIPPSVPPSLQVRAGGGRPERHI